MKTIIFASLAVAALTSATAFAADLSAPVYKAPPPPAPTWTGCYIDAGAGYGFWKQDHYAETDPGFVALTPTTSTGGEGWLGRFGGGCDYQAPLLNGRVVVGAFGDYDVMDLQGTYQDSFSGFTGTESETGSWAVGGRLGYLVTPNLLAYGDGGYTQARFDQTNLSTDTVPSFATPFSIPGATYKGWFVGGGTEYALNMDWIPIRGLFWRTEYRFASYQSTDLPIQPLSITATAEHNEKDVQTVTSSIVWRFNWGGPLVTRY